MSLYCLTLTATLAEFRVAHPEFVAENNAAGFLSDNGGAEYNLCHCECLACASIPALTLLGPCAAVWSNFEVADMDFWRGPAYNAYFELLESKGGFYYEVLARSSHPYSRTLINGLW
jgi:alpha 1,2-mannosyltransferase